MTVFNVATDLPADINTLERLAVWVGMALKRCNAKESVIEVAGNYGELVAQTVLLQASDGTVRSIIRLSIEVDAGYAEKEQKFWLNAKEISSTALPAAYKKVQAQ